MRVGSLRGIASGNRERRRRTWERICRVGVGMDVSEGAAAATVLKRKEGTK